MLENGANSHLFPLLNSFQRSELMLWQFEKMFSDVKYTWPEVSLCSPFSVHTWAVSCAFAPWCSHLQSTSHLVPLAPCARSTLTAPFSSPQPMAATFCLLSLWIWPLQVLCKHNPTASLVLWLPYLMPQAPIHVVAGVRTSFLVQTREDSIMCMYNVCTFCFSVHHLWVDTWLASLFSYCGWC